MKRKRKGREKEEKRKKKGREKEEKREEKRHFNINVQKGLKLAVPKELTT